MEPLPQLPEPYVLTAPKVQLAHVVLTSPHSGRYYSDDFLAASRLNALAIRRSEDSFVEELYAAGPELGIPLLAATYPRAYCDLNRETWELDPEMFEDALPDYVNIASPRVTAGLGTIARIVATGETIYRRKLIFAEVLDRITRCWLPYHAALESLIDETCQTFGACLVIDCHSMPRSSPNGPAGGVADVVIGDGYGTTCMPRISAFVEARLTQLGLQVRRNDPYAGGYITRHYGQPRNQVHVLQIELARSMYMDERLIQKHGGFVGLNGKLKEFLAALAEMSRVLLATDDFRHMPSAAE